MMEVQSVAIQRHGWIQNVLKVELNGPKGRLGEECGMRGEEVKVPKNDSEVSGLKA